MAKETQLDKKTGILKKNPCFFTAFCCFFNNVHMFICAYIDIIIENSTQNLVLRVCFPPHSDDRQI